MNSLFTVTHTGFSKGAFSVCGIIGIVALSNALKESLGTVLYRCLKNLEYRGYDSVGYAVIDSNSRLIVKKSKGKIDDVYTKLGFSETSGFIGIGHTRWATHGKPSDKNAHPHTDCYGRIAVVHNGIIENFRELRKWLESRGHVFKSETDTEVIPHLIEEFKRLGMDSYTAFKKAISVLRGTFAIIAIDIDVPDRIFFAKNTSPLVIGFGDKAMFIASDIPAFLDFTNRVLVLYDGEVGYVTVNRVFIESIEQGTLDGSFPRTKPVSYDHRIRVIAWSREVASKGGYPHFMLKEILEQPQALAQTIAGLREGVDEAIELLRKAEKIVFVAAGSSYHAAFIGRLAMINLGGVWSDAIVSSEARWYVSGLSDRDVVIAVSQSGETIDTLLAVREAKRVGARVIAVSNVVDSAIPRESDVAIYTRAGPEIGVAATKTFTTQIATLLYLAVRLGLAREAISEGEVNTVIQDLIRIPRVVERVLERYSNVVKSLADRVFEKINSCYYLGRGLGLGVAMEGALKMKEIAYVHAEAYPAGESKHGPIALVEKGFPVIFISLGNIDRELIESNIEEMKSRDAITIAIAPKGSEFKSADHLIKMPKIHPYVLPIAAIVPLQLLAYYVAVNRGHDPDKPRNLAKTVTVV